MLINKNIHQMVRIITSRGRLQQKMEKYGLLGEKLGHSYSKEIHEIFFELTGKNASYEMIEKEIGEIEELMESIRNGKFNGINVTIPYKLEVIKYLDEVSETAKKIGAVNTITLRDGKLIGDNSDYFGFLKTLELNGINVNGKKVLVLGTGGASKAIGTIASQRGATLSQLQSGNLGPGTKGISTDSTLANL